MPEDPTRILPPVVVNGVRPPDRDAFVSNLPPTVSPPASYPRDVIEISPTDPIPNPIANPCVARLVADIVNADYPEGIGEEGMQALRALAKSLAPQLYNASQDPSGYAEFASLLVLKGDNSLMASGPLTSDLKKNVVFDTDEALNFFRSLNSNDTIVGMIHTHSADGRPSPEDANAFDGLTQQLYYMATVNASVDDKAVSYIIDGTGIVREYNAKQLENIEGNADDKFGAIINNDGTIDVTTDCENL